MSNMSYCRFTNTLGNLVDCQEHMEDGGLSEDERMARITLINVCCEIADDFGEEDANE